MDEPNAPTLKRSLSLPLITFYGLGTIVGAGIYVLIGKVAAITGLYAPLAFVFAAVLAAFTAFSYAELSARFPRSAGEAVYIFEGTGMRPLAVGVGLAVVTVGIVSTATLANGVVGYVEIFISLPREVIIIVFVAALGLLAAWGITESATAAILISIVEIGGLILIIVIAAPSLARLPARLPELVPPADPGVWLSIAGGAFLAFYAYIGFEDMVNVAEEVKNPTHTLPTAIILALIITTVLYLVVALVAILSLPVKALAASDAPLALLYQHVTGAPPTLIGAISVLAVINGALVQIVMGSRVLYGMSRQGWLPPQLGRVNPRTRTPLATTALVVTAVLGLALWLPLTLLAQITSLITLGVFALVNLALWRVKARDPNPSGIRVYPRWVPGIGVVIIVAFLVAQVPHLF